MKCNPMNSRNRILPAEELVSKDCFIINKRDNAGKKIPETFLKFGYA